MTLNSRDSRVAIRIRRVWSELAYAQRRMFEIRTGLPPARPRFTVDATELERHLHLGSTEHESQPVR